MKKIAYLLILLCVCVGCIHNHKKTKIQRMVEKYAVVTLSPPDISYISDNGKEVLNLYKFIANQADSIYWKQFFGNEKLMTSLPNYWEREYALINYGPWDRITGNPFVSGYGTMPLGANFYPTDMSNKEFESLEDLDKLSPYTLIRRGEGGRLKVEWYHDAYKNHIDKMCSYLTAAADITIKPSVRNYLLKMAEAIKTDNYHESSLAWLDMKDSKMDLVVGPTENVDDRLYGIKRSYEAIVLLKDTAKTEQINAFTSKLADFQAMLPCANEMKTFTPGTGSNIFACNAIYYAGRANAGIKVIALNLPHDTNVQREKGTRTILLKNIIEEKFNRIVYPTGQVVIEHDQQTHLDMDAFFWNIVFGELSHGLGVKQTLNGLDIYQTLGNQASTFETIKSSVVGLYLLCQMIDRAEIPSLITKEDAMTTYLADLIRSERFGKVGTNGKANIIIFNYLKEKGAFTRTESEKYVIDYNKMLAAVENLANTILTIQANGDYQYANTFVADYSKLSNYYSLDSMHLGLEHIPVDLRFKFAK